MRMVSFLNSVDAHVIIKYVEVYKKNLGPLTIFVHTVKALMYLVQSIIINNVFCDVKYRN